MSEFWDEELSLIVKGKTIKRREAGSSVIGRVDEEQDPLPTKNMKRILVGLSSDVVSVHEGLILWPSNRMQGVLFERAVDSCCW